VAVLWPLLFIIFINDIDNGIANKLLKFVDDAKLVGIVSSPLEVKELNGSVKEPDMFHNYETEKINRKASDMAENV